MKQMLENAKAAKAQVAKLTTQEKNQALLAMADALLSHQEAILAANAADLEAAKGTVAQVMLDRLLLNEQRIDAMAQGIREVAALPDPVGRTLAEHTRPDGLKIQKVSVPMGVIAIIYESRPNVTSDAAALALKSGSVCVLRGGKEAFRSANAIVDALRAGLKAQGITENTVNLVQDTSRSSAAALMTANGYVDLLIPRGGAGLINACVRSATVPCIATGTGICHVYVEKTADLDMALNIVENAKTSRPSVCNAEEVCLVHSAVAESVPAALRCVTANNCNVLAMGGFYVAPRTGMAMADAFLEHRLGDGYEDWEGFYEFHKLGYDELENFDYAAYKANGFQIVNPGYAPLGEEPKGHAY